MMQSKVNIRIRGSRERDTVLDVFWNDDFEKRPTLLFCHGYKGFKDWGPWNKMSEYFASRGFTAVKFNFSYNGGTVEDPMDFPDLKAFALNNYSTELADLKKVIDQLDHLPGLEEGVIDMDKLFLIGHSRGGAIATIAAATDLRIKKLATWAAVSDLGMRFQDEEAIKKWKEDGVIHVENARTRQQMPHYYQFYIDYLKYKDDFDVVGAAGKIDKPWLIAHSEDDTTVPVSQAVELHSANLSSDLLLLDNGGHTFGCKHPYEQNEFPEAFETLLLETSAFLFGE